ncbi:hypothetical protein EYF80_008182 [Liparis tanakae]|uniref:Uncharacterized protein n=1 Tax=Liparis tanakae TaxID=230148 RepID=A0A4Z2IV45_9TELE|nr:hypothetical protein EYF80_008182 [Liparis tanakae]
MLRRVLPAQRGQTCRSRKANVDAMCQTISYEFLSFPAFGPADESGGRLRAAGARRALVDGGESSAGLAFQGAWATATGGNPRDID